ncbi:MAG: hypothetical protein HY457_02220 [Parcubacteria group bacterium]|nr:hypothetical protein [Parcubacteria group bacterium]
MRNFTLETVYNKGAGAVNEDVLLATSRTIGVFDGVTSLVGFKDARGNTGGQIAARIAAEEFAVGTGSLAARAGRANERIRTTTEDAGVDFSDKLSRWGVVAAAIELRNDGMFDFFTVGDCMILGVPGNGTQELLWGSSELLTPYVDLDIETLRRCKELAAQRVRDIPKHLRPHIVKVRQASNVKYGVLNGDPNAAEFYQTGTADTRKYGTLLLFTDGFLIPKEDPDEEPDWDRVASLYGEHGLRGVLKEIRTREEKDPNLWRYPRVKASDDATAIAIHFNQ